MGQFCYESRVIEIDDRLLAHLKFVILSKLRRAECFAFNWADEDENGGSRSTFWMHPYLALEFKFDSSTPAVLNRPWLEALMDSANAMSGLRPLPEPETPAPGTGAVPASPNTRIASRR
jgi:hypothetical protein